MTVAQGRPEIRRRPDWRSRLSAAIEARRRSRFAWGSNNCAFAVAEWVAAMTDVDLSAEYRGRVGSAAEAETALRESGYQDLCALLSAHFAEISPVFAQAGDIGALPSETAGWAIGIVIGERVTVLREDGLGTLPRSAMTRAFRVP